jgi:hypothetical protein
MAMRRLPDFSRVTSTFLLATDLRGEFRKHADAPVEFINAALDERSKARMWPIPLSGNEAMLHWIEMNIFDVGGIVALVADEVFLEPVLPNWLLIASWTLRVPFAIGARKSSLDEHPTRSEIGIAGRK